MKTVPKGNLERSSLSGDFGQIICIACMKEKPDGIEKKVIRGDERQILTVFPAVSGGGGLMYFKKSGEVNTESALQIAKEEAVKKGIRYVVVASTTGNTGRLAAKLFNDTVTRLIVVTHNTGFKEDGVQSLSDKMRKEIESYGATVYTATMVLRGIGSAIRKSMWYSDEQIVADTLRILCQGIKVCVEIAAMTCDAGLVPPEDIITVAGTHKGADTVCVIKASSSNHFFDIKVREILCKPIDW